jgi:hypothetical protein
MHFNRTVSETDSVRCWFFGRWVSYGHRTIELTGRSSRRCCTCERNGEMFSGLTE